MFGEHFVLTLAFCVATLTKPEPLRWNAFRTKSLNLACVVAYPLYFAPLTYGIQSQVLHSTPPDTMRIT